LRLKGKSRKVVIGVGNAYRGDDGVGLSVVRDLRERNAVDIEILEATGDCTSLIESWKDAEVVILVDALQSGARPGAISRFCLNSEPFPTAFSRHSTHALGIAEIIELARTLDRLPPSLIVYAVEGKNFQTGAELSPEVREAVPTVANSILKDLL
jgi:hydrogenase maturation protease